MTAPTPATIEDAPVELGLMRHHWVAGWNAAVLAAASDPPSAPTGDHGGLRVAVVATILEHRPSGLVNSREGWVECICGERLPCTFTELEGWPADIDPDNDAEDVARAEHLAAALAAHPVPEPAQDGEVGRVAAVLAEHHLRLDNASRCACGNFKIDYAAPEAWYDQHATHVAAVLVAARGTA